MARKPWETMWNDYTQWVSEARGAYAAEISRIRRMPGLSDRAREAALKDARTGYEANLEELRTGQTGSDLMERFERDQTARVTNFTETFGPDRGAAGGGGLYNFETAEGPAAGMSFTEYYTDLFGAGTESDYTDEELERLAGEAVAGRGAGSGTGTSLDIARIGQQAPRSNWWSV